MNTKLRFIETCNINQTQHYEEKVCFVYQVFHFKITQSYLIKLFEIEFN